MSRLSKLFTEGSIYVPTRNTHDLSHENFLTTHVGTITPVLVEEVTANTTVSVGIASQVTLPPMAADFFGRIDACFEAFFVPYRLCYGGWEDFISSTRGLVSKTTFAGSTTTSEENGFVSATTVNAFETPITDRLPALQLQSNTITSGSLLDYLGCRAKLNTGGSPYAVTISNVMPIVAYHRIYESWYRPTNLQSAAFVKPDQATISAAANIRYLPFVRHSSFTYLNSSGSGLFLNDSTNVLSLRQRCWGLDRFTAARLHPVGGFAGVGFDDNTVEIDFDTSSDSVALSVGTIRAANTLQMYMDRANIVGSKYRDAMFAKYGCTPSTGIVEPVFLGQCKFNCYNKGIYQTSVEPGQEGNPFNTVGSEYARTESKGTGSLINGYLCKESGLIFVNFTLVPHAYYSTGTRRYLMNSYATDFPDALLQQLGDDVIYQSELRPDSVSDMQSSPAFGYTPRYSYAVYHDDEVHGLLQDTRSLQVYALQRSFDDDTPLSIGLTFVQIPKDYLDQVGVTSAKVSDYGCMLDTFFSERITSPIVNSVVPTLGKPDGMHKASVNLYSRSLQ